MKKYLFIWGLFFTIIAYGGNDYLNPGARSAGLGSASLCHTEVFSIFANPAGLMGMDAFSAGIAAQNRFLLNDLTLLNLGIALPTRSGNFGLGMYYFGGSALNEKEFRLGYARNFLEGLSAGISLDFHQLSQQSFGSATLITFDLGIRYAINDKIVAAAKMHNPTRQKMGDNSTDQWPTLLSFGLSYNPSDKTGIYAEFEKNIDQKAIIKTGVEYLPIEKLALRLGYSSNANSFSAGIGLVLPSIYIDIAGSFHQDLGYSPYISFVYKGPKKNTNPALDTPEKL